MKCQLRQPHPAKMVQSNDNRLTLFQLTIIIITIIIITDVDQDHGIYRLQSQNHRLQPQRTIESIDSGSKAKKQHGSISSKRKNTSTSSRLLGGLFGRLFAGAIHSKTALKHRGFCQNPNSFRFLSLFFHQSTSHRKDADARCHCHLCGRSIAVS